jgi:ribosomal protein S17E
MRQPSPDDFEEPKFSTKRESRLSETHEELFSPNFDTEKERIKNMMKN